MPSFSKEFLPCQAFSSFGNSLKSWTLLENHRFFLKRKLSCPLTLLKESLISRYSKKSKEESKIKGFYNAKFFSKILKWLNQITLISLGSTVVLEKKNETQCLEKEIIKFLKESKRCQKILLFLKKEKLYFCKPLACDQLSSFSEQDFLLFSFILFYSLLSLMVRLHPQKLLIKQQKIFSSFLTAIDSEAWEVDCWFSIDWHQFIHCHMHREYLVVLEGPRSDHPWQSFRHSLTGFS